MLNRGPSGTENMLRKAFGGAVRVEPLADADRMGRRVHGLDLSEPLTVAQEDAIWASRGRRVAPAQVEGMDTEGSRAFLDRLEQHCLDPRFRYVKPLYRSPQELIRT